MNKYDYYAKQISSMLSVTDCFEYYGLKPDHRGFVCCPFHSEKTASLRVWEDHWKCFGCGEYGDNISFVRKMFDLSFTNAIKKLNEDFGLGIDIGKPQFSNFKRFEMQMKKARRERSESELRRQEDLEKYYELVDTECALKRIVKNRAPKTEEDTPDSEWVEALHWLPYVTYLLDNYEVEGGPPG